jgi:hypothetical protein
MLEQFAQKGFHIKPIEIPPVKLQIKRQMFSFVTKNWRNRPLDSLTTVVNLIANTTTEAGLHNEADIDGTVYEKGIAVSDEEMESLNIKRDKFHGEWNYKIMPQK